jgi:hypothetical protein
MRKRIFLFPKRITFSTNQSVFFRFTFWTAGYKLWNLRGSLAKMSAEGVSWIISRWIWNRWLGLDRGGRWRHSRRNSGPAAIPRRRHGRKHLSRATEHELANGKLRERENDMASSPRAKSWPGMKQGERAARRGGRWRRTFGRGHHKAVELRFAAEWRAGKGGGSVFIVRRWR